MCLFVEQIHRINRTHKRNIVFNGYCIELGLVSVVIDKCDEVLLAKRPVMSSTTVEAPLKRLVSCTKF